MYLNYEEKYQNPPWFAPKLPKIKKKPLKKWLLFSCVFIFAGTVDDSVFCNHFSWMSKLVIFGYPIATPFRKSRSDIWNVVRFFCIADNVYPTPLFNQGDVICDVIDYSRVTPGVARRHVFVTGGVNWRHLLIQSQP